MSDLTKKSGIVYLAVFLFLVCAIATALMAAAKLLTDEPIAAAKTVKTLDSKVFYYRIVKRSINSKV